jgi:hypothetical protein
MMLILTQIWSWLKTHPGVYLAAFAVVLVELVRLAFFVPRPQAPSVDLSKVDKAEGKAEAQREEAHAIEAKIPPAQKAIETADAEEKADLEKPAPSGLDKPGAVASWLTGAGL